MLDLSALPPVEAPASAPDAAQYVLGRMLDGEALAEALEAARAAGYARNEVYRARLRVARLLEAEKRDADGGSADAMLCQRRAADEVQRRRSRACLPARGAR